MSALEGVNQSQNQTSNPSSVATPSKRKQAKPQRIEDKVDEKSTDSGLPTLKSAAKEKSKQPNGRPNESASVSPVSIEEQFRNSLQRSKLLLTSKIAPGAPDLTPPSSSTTSPPNNQLNSSAEFATDSSSPPPVPSMPTFSMLKNASAHLAALANEGSLLNGSAQNSRIGQDISTMGSALPPQFAYYSQQLMEMLRANLEGPYPEHFLRLLNQQAELKSEEAAQEESLSENFDHSPSGSSASSPDNTIMPALSDFSETKATFPRSKSVLADRNFDMSSSRRESDCRSLPATLSFPQYFEKGEEISEELEVEIARKSDVTSEDSPADFSMGNKSDQSHVAKFDLASLFNNYSTSSLLSPPPELMSHFYTTTECKSRKDPNTSQNGSEPNGSALDLSLTSEQTGSSQDAKRKRRRSRSPKESPEKQAKAGGTPPPQLTLPPFMPQAFGLPPHLLPPLPAAFASQHSMMSPTTSMPNPMFMPPQAFYNPSTSDSMNKSNSQAHITPPHLLGPMILAANTAGGRSASEQQDSDDDWESMMEVNCSDEAEKIRALVGDKAVPVTDSNQCVICRRVLSCKSALQMHYRTHTGERPFKCKICQRAFTTKGNLKTHMGVHKSKHSFRTHSVNGLGRAPNAGFAAAFGGMGQHQCPICQKKFFSPQLLQQHILGQHTSQLARNGMFPLPPHMLTSPSSSLSQSQHPNPFLGTPPSFEALMNHSFNMEQLAQKKKSPEPAGSTSSVGDAQSTHTSTPSPLSTANKSNGNSVEDFLQSSSFGMNPFSSASNSAPTFNAITSSPNTVTSQGQMPSLSQNGFDGKSLAASPLVPASIPPHLFPTIFGFPFFGMPPTSTPSASSPMFGNANVPNSAGNLTSNQNGVSNESPIVPTTSSSDAEAKANPLPSMEPTSIQLPPLPPLFSVSSLTSSASESIKSETTQAEIRESALDLKRKFKDQTARSTTRKDSLQLSGQFAGQSTELKSENVKMESVEDKEKAENQSESDSKATGLPRMPPAQLGNPLDAIQKMYAETENTEPPPRQMLPLSKHQCAVCRKHFSSGSALQIHMRTHTGERPYKCDCCSRTFTTRGNLKVHMSTHDFHQNPSRRGRRIFDFPMGQPSAQSAFAALAQSNPMMAMFPFMGLENPAAMLGLPPFMANAAMTSALAQQIAQTKSNGGQNQSDKGKSLNDGESGSPSAVSLMQGMHCPLCQAVLGSPQDLYRHLEVHINSMGGGREENGTNQRSNEEMKSATVT
ncbi:zinc-finger double domain-containing protein [Ditylenchus destructor]|uniref:Zinc-finger double domain-containing protein n=1 Tax=Ditylenchus destructor TaxID=166010 RepID=A0AAD4MU80_9BILA|nr:zinc-finger double domain-containing protein [Ditylenchus destructor]